MKKFLITLALVIMCVSPVFAADSTTEAMLEYNQGIDFFKIGQYDKSVDCFRQAIKLDPNYIDAYYNLGSILEYMQQYDAALAVFKQIIVRKPTDYDSVYKAAWISYQLGQFDKAKTYLGIIPQDSARSSDAQDLMQQLSVCVTDVPLRPEKTASQPAPSLPKASAATSETNHLYQNITSPTGVVTDKDGNVYVAEFTNNQITKITPEDKKIVYVKDAKISGPIGLARDAQGNIYVANYNKDNVLKISNLGEVSVLINNVKKPYCLYLEGNILFISSQGSSSVLKYKLH